jgi:hypothetical protein
VPSPKDYFGTLSAPFQWLDLPKSETLFSQSTRSTKKPVCQKYESTRGTKKLEAPVQKFEDQVWRRKSWIFSDPNTPGYSPQPSAPPGKFKI